jgi:hypothetical protein
VGSFTYGLVDRGDPASVTFDVDAASIRAVASKSILSLALLAGAGWDRYSSHVDMTAVDPISSLTGRASTSGFRTSRTVYFAGASMTFLVLQVSGEVGWGSGGDASPRVRGPSGFDPTSGTLFGGVAFRLTF